MKRPSLADIAPEILENIFSFLQSFDLAQCQIVSSKWSRVAQELLYKNIKGFTTYRKFYSFMETISSSPSNPGSYTKSVDLWPLSYTIDQQFGQKKLELTQTAIATIGKYCPKVKSLRGNFNIGVFECLTTQVNAGYFKHLIDVPYSKDEDCLAYANTAIALSRTLYFLAIRYLNLKYGDFDHGINLSVSLVNRNINLQHDVLVSKMNSFANLQSVAISEVNGLGQSLFRYDCIINQFPATDDCSILSALRIMLMRPTKL